MTLGHGGEGSELTLEFPRQPLIDIAEDSLKKRNVSEMVTVLKALGNAGHPGSIKTIMRFLPGVAASTVDLPPIVLSAAVQSLRLVAARDPHNVREARISVMHTHRCGSWGPL